MASSFRAPRWSELPWGKLLWVILVLVAVAALVQSQVDLPELHARAARLNGVVAFALLVVLPLIGFPVSLLHIGAGIRFGPLLGLGLVSLSILLQLLASYAIVRVWRTRFESSRALQRLRRRLPQGAHASVCAFTILLPGAPYVAINYLLPVVGVPLRTLLACAWPLHTLRSTVTVSFGGHSADLTGARLAGLIAYGLTILAASWWMYRRLQSRFAGPRRGAGGRTQRA